jgi:iron complex transport system permease protein
MRVVVKPKVLSFFQQHGTVYAVLLVLPFVLFIYSLTLGVYPIKTADVARILLSPVYPHAAENSGEVAKTLVLRIRLPRILAAMLIGASMAGTGTAFQGIFKNPLVDSNLLGVTSGAGFGAALALSLGLATSEIQLSAFLFGLLAVGLAFFGSRLYRTAPMIVLTLMGVLIGSFFGSLTSLLKYLADPLDTLPAITFWLMGGLTGVTWKDIPLLAAIAVAGGTFLWTVRWQLNILSMGDEEAITLGINATRMKFAIIICCTLMTAAAVSVGGVIGWIGLVIPHAGRIIVGPNHLRLVPVSLSLGACFLLVIDNLSRAVLPAEIPLGVLTGLVGVPLLIALLRRNQTGW